MDLGFWAWKSLSVIRKCRSSHWPLAWSAWKWRIFNHKVFFRELLRNSTFKWLYELCTLQSVYLLEASNLCKTDTMYGHLYILVLRLPRRRCTRTHTHRQRQGMNLIIFSQRVDIRSRTPIETCRNNRRATWVWNDAYGTRDGNWNK